MPFLLANNHSFHILAAGKDFTYYIPASMENKHITTGNHILSSQLLTTIYKWQEILFTNILLFNQLPNDYCRSLSEGLITGYVMLASLEKKIHIPDPCLNNPFEELILKLSYINQVFHTSLFNELFGIEIKVDSQILNEIVLLKDNKIKEELSGLTPESYGVIYEYLRYKHPVNDSPVKAQRKTGGVYYTPTYIVDYIVEKTIGKKLKEGKDSISGLKIYDPSCGSGIFLLRSYDYLIKYLSDSGEVSPGRKKEVITTNLFGTDIDPNAVELTKISLLTKLLSEENEIILPDLSQNFDCINFLLEDTPLFDHFSGKFDVIIGNPPYSAEVNDHEKKLLKKKFEHGTTDSAALFMHLADEKLNDSGINSFIIPKAFTYSSNWKKLREKFLYGLTELIDCGKAWKEVKLEQVIYFYEKEKNYDTYLSGTRKNENIIVPGKIDKHLYEEFGLLLNGISGKELETGLKIKNAGYFLNDLVTNHRGAPLQKFILNDESDFKVLGGKQILGYIISNEGKGYFALEQLNDSKAIIKNDSILVQNIVAHIQNPEPAIKIIAALSNTFPERDYIILDTVNQLQNTGIYSSEFICAVLNSKLLSWYVYNFIFGRAIRTMHFDNYVTSRIPFPKIDFSNHSQEKTYRKVEELVHRAAEKKKAYLDTGTFRKKLLKKNADRSVRKITEEIDELITRLYGIKKEEINTHNINEDII